MATKTLQELSIEELQKKVKQLKIGSYALVGVMILLMVFKKFSSVGIVLLPIILLTQQWDKVQKELKSRENA